jgi:hypothetical protein
MVPPPNSQQSSSSLSQPNWVNIKQLLQHIGVRRLSLHCQRTSCARVVTTHQRVLTSPQKVETLNLRVKGGTESKSTGGGPCAAGPSGSLIRYSARVQVGWWGLLHRAVWLVRKRSSACFLHNSASLVAFKCSECFATDISECCCSCLGHVGLAPSTQLFDRGKNELAHRCYCPHVIKAFPH